MYAALVKTDPAAPDYDMAIAVAVERNWKVENGKVADAGDKNNAAAKIAFQIIKQIRQE